MSRIYQFGEFRLHADEHLLTVRGGERILLTPRSFALLVKLVENAPRVVKKETLMREVWADAIVEDGNLNRTVSNLRKALGEKPNENRFIETVPRVGYRFIAHVSLEEGEKGRRGEGEFSESENKGQKTKEEGQKPNRKSKIENQKSKWFVPVAVVILIAVAAACFFVWRGRQNASAVKSNEENLYLPVRLTDNPNDDVHPNWTRDGRIRFFRTDANRQTESWIMSADGANQVLVKAFDNFKHGWWSPDGGRVIFAKPNDKTAYYLADATGANEIALPFYAGNFDWAFDSRSIVYQKSIGANNSEIFVYSLDTGASRNVTEHAAFDADPSFSPDGKQIVFVSSRDDNSEIYTLDLAGGAVRRLTNHPADDSHPSFSPDGTNIAFTSDREDENADVYLMRADGDGAGAKRLTDWKSNETVVPGCWSPDGTKIAFFSDRHGKDDIYVVSAEVFRPRLVLADENNHLGAPFYAPDGGQIVYQTEAADKSGELRIFEFGTKQTRLLTKNENAGFAPAWSPDGERIAFQNRVGGNTEICLINPNGGEIQNLTAHSARDLAPAWSPDGGRIAFASNRDGGTQIFHLCLMNADGSNQHRIYSSNGISTAPAWSPDGKEVAFANDKEDNRTGNFEIFSIEPETNEPEKRLTFRRRFDTFPSYSPDGSRLAFVSEVDGNAEIYLMNRDGSRLLRVTRNAAEDTAPRWSPDGKQIIFASNRGGKFAIYEIEVLF